MKKNRGKKVGRVVITSQFGREGWIGGSGRRLVQGEAKCRARPAPVLSTSLKIPWTKPVLDLSPKSVGECTNKKKTALKVSKAVTISNNLGVKI